MKYISNIPFPFFLNDGKKNTMLILLTSVFVSLFLIFYKPFQNPNTTSENIVWGVLCFAVLYFNIIILTKLFQNIFDLSSWTILKYLLFNLWLFLFMGLFFSVVNYLFFCNGLFYSNVLWKTQKEVVLTGLIPLFVITLFAKNQLLKQNLADAVEANKELNEIRQVHEGLKQRDGKITLSTDTSETFAFLLSSLIYAAAVDNYSEIYWLNNAKTEMKLLRATLKKVEMQINNQFIIRCHRSYLINVREIESISGNTNGYKLKMKHTDIEIPVSRAKGKEIIEHIRQIKDLLDIS